MNGESAGSGTERKGKRGTERQKNTRGYGGTGREAQGKGRKGRGRQESKRAGKRGGQNGKGGGKERQEYALKGDELREEDQRR